MIAADTYPTSLFTLVSVSATTSDFFTPSFIARHRAGLREDFCQGHHIVLLGYVSHINLIVV